MPLDDGQVTVVVTDKVAFSLRTKDPAVAKGRFTPAFAALSRHFDNVRAGPKALTHKQAVALAGEVYRERVAKLEADVGMKPDRLEAERQEADAAIAEWHLGDGEADDLGEVPIEKARFVAAIQRPAGAALLAWETKQDIESPYVSMTYDAALEALFGRDADSVCAKQAILIDDASRKTLLREIGEAVRDAGEKLARNIGGDYRPDEAAARFPAFERPVEKAPPQPTPRQAAESVSALYERWKIGQAESKAQSTLRRYGPSVESLNRYSKGRDWRLLTASNIFEWAQHRNASEGVSAATVNRNDLVAIASILGWATSINGKKVPEANVAFGIKIQRPKKIVRREKMFRTEEISAILRLARSVEPNPRHPRAAASRRWAPWLCAYSGARIQEVLWLQKSDIRKEAGVDVMCLPKTKNDVARMVPIHKALIEEGFLEFVMTAPNGWLFVADKPAKSEATRSAQEMRAAELASWIQSKIGLEKGVSPQHGWRDTWITYAEAAGIPPRLSNRIRATICLMSQVAMSGRRSQSLLLKWQNFPDMRCRHPSIKQIRFGHVSDASRERRNPSSDQELCFATCSVGKLMPNLDSTTIRRLSSSRIPKLT